MRIVRIKPRNTHVIRRQLEWSNLFSDKSLRTRTDEMRAVINGRFVVHLVRIILFAIQFCDRERRYFPLILVSWISMNKSRAFQYYI